MSFRRRMIMLAAGAVAAAVLIASAIGYVATRDELRGAAAGTAQGGSSAPAPSKQPGRVTARAPGRGRPTGVRIVLPAPKLGGPAGYAQLLTAEGNVLRSGEVGPGLPVSAATRAVAAG